MPRSEIQRKTYQHEILFKNLVYIKYFSPTKTNLDKICNLNIVVLSRIKYKICKIYELIVHCNTTLLAVPLIQTHILCHLLPLSAWKLQRDDSPQLG